MATLVPLFLIESSSFEDTHKSFVKFEFKSDQSDPTLDYRVVALEYLKILMSPLFLSCSLK